jgi:hypothetical protein
MEPIPLYSSTPLEWVQPKTFQNRYELRSGDSLFASLEFPKVFGSLANAVSAEERWSFKRVGFFSTRITVRKEGEETDLAVYHPKWTGTEGSLQFASGAVYTWKVANFWATQFVWLAGEQQIILFRPGVEDSSMSDWFKTQARVEILPAASGVKESSLLILLGWYLMILKQEDDAAATASTTAAVS